MYKILILGASSDIGKNLVSYIIENKKDNVGLHLHSSNKKFYFKKKINKNIKFINSNFVSESEKDILNKFDSDYDIIVNLIGHINSKKFKNLNLSDLINSSKANSFVPLLIFKKSLNYMKKKKRGVIINNSSIGVKFGGGKKTLAYSLSKHINEFIPSIFRALCKIGICYNVIRIGVTDTKIHKKISKKNLQNRINLIPAKRMAKTQEIVNLIYFLIFQNTYISNQIISIRGGE